MRFIGILAQFALFLIVIFIVGQAAIIPVQDALRDSNADINTTDASGDVIINGDAFMESGQRVIFRWLPYMIMVGIPGLVFLYYMRFSSSRPPGGGF